jgi:hypothetical protein
MGSGLACRLFRIDVEDANLGVGTVPVGRDGVKDEAEIAGVPGLEGRGRDGLEIDVRVAGADELEGSGFILGDLFGRVAEEDLDGDRGDGASSCVPDAPVNVGDFAAGEVGGLAHDETGDGQADGVGIGSCGYGGDGDRFVSVLEDEDHSGCHEHDDSGGDGEGEPIALAGFDARHEIDFRVDVGIDFGV